MSRKDRRVAGKPSGPPAADVSAVFALAVRHHQAGQLLEAEGLYRQVLASDGQHFGTLHHLGIIALQRGQARAAVDVIGRAIAVNNRVPDCHYNMAFALQALGRLSEAAVHYRRAVKLKPDYVEAHTNLGNVLKALGSHRDAAACYERRRAVRGDPPEASEPGRARWSERPDPRAKPSSDHCTGTGRSTFVTSPVSASRNATRSFLSCSVNSTGCISLSRFGFELPPLA